MSKLISDKPDDLELAAHEEMRRKIKSEIEAMLQDYFNSDSVPEFLRRAQVYQFAILIRPEELKSENAIRIEHLTAHGQRVVDTLQRRNSASLAASPGRGHSFLNNLN